MNQTYDNGSDDDGKPEWFAFRVRPRHEKSVALHLAEKQQHCFVPLLRKSRTWAKRHVQVDIPLISGYVFCKSERFGMLPILTTPGVIGVIRSSNTPISIPECEISSLERAIEARLPLEPCAYEEVGQSVEIRSGPLAGISGIVSDRRKGEHIILSVSLLRRSVMVQVEAQHLSTHEKAHERPMALVGARFGGLSVSF